MIYRVQWLLLFYNFARITQKLIVNQGKDYTLSVFILSENFNIILKFSFNHMLFLSFFFILKIVFLWSAYRTNKKSLTV